MHPGTPPDLIPDAFKSTVNRGHKCVRDRVRRYKEVSWLHYRKVNVSCRSSNKTVLVRPHVNESICYVQFLTSRRTTSPLVVVSTRWPASLQGRNVWPCSANVDCVRLFLVQRTFPRPTNAFLFKLTPQSLGMGMSYGDKLRSSGFLYSNRNEIKSHCWPLQNLVLLASS